MGKMWASRVESEKGTFKHIWSIRKIVYACVCAGGAVKTYQQLVLKMCVHIYSQMGSFISDNAEKNELEGHI